MVQPADVEELKRLYMDEGLTHDQVAARLGCSAASVRRWLDKLGISSRPRGPRVLPEADNPRCHWSASTAYAVGLLTTDGNLSSDGRHITLTSKDYDLLETLRTCLNLDNAITPQAGSAEPVYRVQFSDRRFYDWLIGIGLMSAKSKQLGMLNVPDEYFADFTRGCFDGDGYIHTYTDRYNTFKNEKYVYERLFVSLVSASRAFVEWLQGRLTQRLGIGGAILEHKPRAGYSPLWVLKYAKYDSIRLLKWIYYAPDVPCLRRKRQIAEPFLI